MPDCFLQEWFSSNKLRSIWLAVHEDGVSLLDSSSMECLVSYSYNEVSTFGCHGDTDFVLVVSPQQQISPSERGKLLQSEKLLLTMPKLKVCSSYAACCMRSSNSLLANLTLMCAQVNVYIHCIRSS